MKIAEFAIRLPGNIGVNACLIALVVASAAGPVSAHHELATRLGMRLPATLKPSPVNAGPGAKPQGAVTEPESQPKTKPAEPANGKRKASENPEKILILGGAEAFPM